MDQHDNAAAPERRSFLGILSGLIAAGIGAVMTATIGRYALQPALTAAASDAKWTEIGALTGIEEGKMVKKNVVIAQDAGWGRFESQRSVWIVRKVRRENLFFGLSAFGLRGEYAKRKIRVRLSRQLLGPFGKLTAGPSPRDLDTLEHRVEGGVLQVRYQSFRQGISAKEVAA